MNGIQIIMITLFNVFRAARFAEFARRRTAGRGARKLKSAVKSGNTWRSIWTKTTWSRGPRRKAGGATARDRSSPRRLPSSTGENPLADGSSTKTRETKRYVDTYICTYI